MTDLVFTYPGADPQWVGRDRSAEVVEWLGLLGAAPKVGGNTRTGAMDGRRVRRLSGDELDSDVEWELAGGTDLAGNPSVQTPAAQARTNWRELAAWFRAAPDGQVTVLVTEDDGSKWKAAAQWVKFGVPRFTGPIQVRQLVVVPDGFLTELVPVTGTAASTLPAVTSAAAGTHTPPVFAGGAVSTLAAVTQSAAGTHTAPVFTGTGTSDLPAVTQAAAGTVTAP